MSNKQEKSSPLRSNRASSAYKSKTDPPMYFAKCYLDGRETEETIIEDGITYERTDYIELDLDSIPQHVRDDLSRSVLIAVKEFYAQPGAEERYQKWLKNRKKTSKH